jgi:SMC interacting uncharacterized protein involved in chromosome segregation
MTDQTNKNNDLAEVAHSIGLLSGKLEVMHSSITDNFKTLREDMRRMEDANKISMQHLEDRLNNKIEGVGNRVKILEAEEKVTIATQAKHAVGYSIGGGLIVTMVSELVKHFK